MSLPTAQARGRNATRQRSPTEERVAGLLGALERFVDRGDTENGRAGLERRAPDIDRAVPVAIRLDHGPELGAVERFEQALGVVPDRAKVDRDLAATGGLSRQGRAQGQGYAQAVVVEARRSTDAAGSCPKTSARTGN